MKKTYSLLAFATALLFFANTLFGQCVIPVTDGTPFIEDFEGEVFECWTVDSIGGGHWATMTGTASTAVAFSYTNNGDEARLISPILDISTVEEATLSFSYAMMGLYQTDELSVCYRSDEADPWHTLGTFSVNDWSNYYDENYTLPNLSSTYQISFLGRGLGGYYVFIDNVEVASTMSCGRPINLEVSNIEATSALLHWSTTGNEERWVVELNGEETMVNTQPYLMENLIPTTLYSFRVKAICADGETSGWSTPITFTTFCETILVTDENPFFDDFEGSGDFVCWKDEILYGDLGWAIDPGYVTPNNTAFFIWLGIEARLNSAPLDISSVSNPTLTFMRKQPINQNKNDELSVWYRTAESEEWQFLENYDYAATSWEEITLPLPNPSSTYQISFKALSKNSGGVFVDDVRVGRGSSTGVVETLSAAVRPNPTTGKVTVSTNTADGEITVFDLFGKQVAHVLVVEGHADIDLGSLAKGIYMARITGTTGSTTIKLVKE